MPSVNDLEVRFSSQQGTHVRYLCELNSKPDMWQEGQQGRGAI